MKLALVRTFGASKQNEVLVDGGTSQPAAPVTAPLPDARPAWGSMPTLHEKPRIP